jgi:hypothetical protein
MIENKELHGSTVKRHTYPYEMKKRRELYGVGIKRQTYNYEKI